MIIQTKHNYGEIISESATYVGKTIDSLGVGSWLTPELFIDI
jgi:hypothetical protein